MDYTRTVPNTPVAIEAAVPSENVVSAQIGLCSLPLPHPVRLGTASYARRDYIVVRLTDDEGREGFSFGYTRNLSLVPMVEQVARAVIGTSPRNRTETIKTITSATPSVLGSLARSTSLVDIALWDLAAKQANRALAELLGVARREVPVMAVAGYFRQQRGDDAILEEVSELGKQGYSRIKLMLGALDSPDTFRLLERARDILDERTLLVVDAHYSFRDIEQALAAVRRLAAIGVSLLEDPFLPSDWRKMVPLSIPGGPGIAAGEDVADPSQFLDLLDIASVLRIDPTTCGGIRAAISGIEAAALRGIPVIPHVFTALAGQLAAAFPIVAAVEYIPPVSQSDPLDAFFSTPARIEKGQLLVDLSPGVGMGLNWQAVTNHCLDVVEVR